MFLVPFFSTKKTQKNLSCKHQISFCWKCLFWPKKSKCEKCGKSVKWTTIYIFLKHFIFICIGVVIFYICLWAFPTFMSLMLTSRYYPIGILIFYMCFYLGYVVSNVIAVLFFPLDYDVWGLVGNSISEIFEGE